MRVIIRFQYVDSKPYLVLKQMLTSPLVVVFTTKTNNEPSNVMTSITFCSHEDKNFNHKFIKIIQSFFNMSNKTTSKITNICACKALTELLLSTSPTATVLICTVEHEESSAKLSCNVYLLN